MEIRAELQQINRSAAGSLREGIEDTLTLHRLGILEEVGRSLKTTNAIERLGTRLGYCGSSLPIVRPPDSDTPTSLGA